MTMTAQEATIAEPVPAAPTTKIVLEARDIVKELGHGAGKGARAEGRQPLAACR